MYQSAKTFPERHGFANGDWTDLPQVLPLVDRLVGECGWAPYVMETFLTMAERAGVSYPIDAFVTLVTKVLEELSDNSDGLGRDDDSGTHSRCDPSACRWQLPTVDG